MKDRMLGKRIQLTALDIRTRFDGLSLMPEGLDVGECGTVVGEMVFREPKWRDDLNCFYLTVDFDCGIQYTITGDDGFRVIRT